MRFFFNVTIVFFISIQKTIVSLKVGHLFHLLHVIPNKKTIGGEYTENCEVKNMNSTTKHNRDEMLHPP